MSIQILGNQIASDFDSLTKDMEAGLIDRNHVESELIRIGEKIKEWGVEATEIIEEAGIDNIVDSEQEFRAERSAIENN